MGDITPGRELSLFGYGFREAVSGGGNDGVLDPLTVRALVVSVGESVVWVVVSLDLCVVPTGLAGRWRTVLGEKLGIEAGRIWISATHTHSGPLLREPGRLGDWGAAASEPAGEVEKDYAEAVERTVFGMVQRAAALRYPVRVSLQAAPLGVGYDRRVRQPDGSVRLCWEPQEFPEREPGGAMDPNCTVLYLRQRNGPREWVVWNLGLHPVVLGKTSNRVSADFVGRTHALLEAGHPWRRALFLNAASGHTQPWVATQENAAGLESVGQACAGTVALLCAGARPLKGMDRFSGKPPFALETVEIGGRPLPISVGRIGELWLVGVSVELFEELGLVLRERLGGAVILGTLTHGWDGYLPHAAGFAEGAYEVEVARRFGYEAGDGERLVERLLAMAEGLA